MNVPLSSYYTYYYDNPDAPWIVSGNTLYGTAVNGGTNRNGTVVQDKTNGTGYTILYNFTASSNAYFTNSDGAGPQGGLVLSGNTLYGAALGGGTNGDGTVFALTTSGTGFRNLHNFAGSPSDGDVPLGGLILSGNTLYGTTLEGGLFDNGTVFSVNTNGTGYATLYSFTAVDPNTSTNSDGAGPHGGLVLSGNTLYGTAVGGGSAGWGTVFAINTNGSDFVTLHSFSALASTAGTNSDGAQPLYGLVLSGNTLYGITTGGGLFDNGTVFSLTLPPPQLTIITSSTNVILTWPTNVTGFTLESTPNLGAAAAWNTNSTAPVVITGQNVVTNPITGTQQFYRLIH
jgi:uncharacterized repeat protein (TIGR03803 family)